MMLAAPSQSTTAVFIGAALALTLTLSALLGVVFGEAITRVVPTQVIHMVAGGAFEVLGALLLTGKM